MKSDEFLSDLKVEFREWRQRKAFNSEPIPGSLMTKAKAAAAKHGVGRVASALMVEGRRLKPCLSDAAMPAVPTKARVLAKPAVAAKIPSYSRIEVAGSRGPQPLMEAETPVGVKLRVFAITPETIGVLSSFCRAVGGEP